VHEVALIARTEAERVVLGPLMQRAARRASRPCPGGLAAVLTEPQVAALIFGESIAATHSGPTSSTPQLYPSTVCEEAGREVERLRYVRRLADAGERDAVSGVAVTRARLHHGRIEPGLVALYQLWLTDRTGTRWHAEIFALRVALTGRRQHIKTLINQRVSELTQPRVPRMAAALARQVEPALIVASEVYRTCAAALQVRDEGGAAMRASAARQLVQAGLFDIRASQRDARMPAHVSMPGLQAPAAPVLCVDMQLIGVLDVRRS
jgi:hypothetical protein